MMNGSIFYILTFLGTWCAFVCTVGDAVAQHRNRNHRKPILSPVTSSRDRKPNIVLILTDDQDVELGSLNFMPKTLRAIRDKGAEFRHAYVTTPMCCPSRSSLLTGMYMHNHNVYTNNDNCSSTQWQATYETRSFATYLSNAGYRTGYFGKYLNKYNGSYIPPGWREWGGLIMNSKYYNYSINMNGKKIKHGFDYHKDYYPDLIANDSVAFLRQSKRNSAHKPVMLTMSFPAPHGPEDAAPQYSHLFFNVTTHHTPSYDYAPNTDKQWILQVTNKMQPIHKEFTDLLMTKRLQTLQSVDSAVERVIEELEALGELHNTYIIYTSDHGYHLGQFGLVKGKSFPFEFDVRVPFLVRGPGVEPGTVVDDIVLNIDLAPTFLDMAGVETPLHMDGHSALPLFLNTKRKRLKWPDTFLIESSGRREYSDARQKHTKQHVNITDTVVNIRTTELSNISTTTLKSVLDHDSVEEVDVTEDLPYEDDDDGEILHEDDEEDKEIVDDEEDEDIVEEEHLKGGQAQLDNQLLPAIPTSKLERLAIDCLRDEYQLPCQHGQKWYCQHEYGRWRKHKCKLQLPIVHKKSFRKCACFTPNGLVYRKIPVNVTTQIKKPSRISRVKREHTGFRKSKRNTLAHVDSIMQTIRDELNGLHDVNSTLPEEQALQKTSLDTNIIEATPGCAISDSGKVNCSMLVYQNRKMWRQSRHYVDNEIQRLRQKLDNLKEIRRHLKYTRPNILHNMHEMKNNSNSEIETFNETQQNDTEISDTPTRINRKRKKLHEPDNENIVANKIKIDDVFNVSGLENTTTIIENHHRHHHQRKHHHDNLTSTETVRSVVNLTTVIPHIAVNRTLMNTSLEKRGPKTTPKQRLLPNELHTEPNSNTSNNEYCHCETDESYKLAEKDLTREAKQKIKDERLRKRERRQRKKAKLEKECLSEKMNCFSHDNDHWRTPPLWTSGPFCFCMNANNNTYSCIRTINTTHNFLYCEFTTGEISYYNLRIDPFELQNRYNQLKVEERLYLHDQLLKLMACRGKSCVVSKTRTGATIEISMQNQRYHKRRKFMDDIDTVARSLPLSQSALSPNQHFFYNTRSNKLPKRRRRRNQTHPQREFGKVQRPFGV